MPRTDAELLEDVEVEDRWATFSYLGVPSYLYREDTGWIVQRSDYGISGDPNTLRDDKTLLEWLARVCELLNRKDGLAIVQNPAPITRLPFELAEAQGKIGDILNGLQNKFGYEVVISVDSMQSVGHPQFYSVVTLEAEVKGA